MPSVVNIYTSKEVRHRQPLTDDPILRRFFPGLDDSEPRRATSLGSGVIVSSEGYVLTNNHVVEEADDIELVLADGRRMHAAVRGSDPESDLAVLKIDGKNLPVITFGQLENVQVGDTVLAIGSPFGFGSTRHARASSARWAAAIWASTGSRTSSRPMPQSTRAIPAARWSTAAATWSASTARYSRKAAARKASASRSRCRSPRACSSRSSRTAK